MLVHYFKLGTYIMTSKQVILFQHNGVSIGFSIEH